MEGAFVSTGLRIVVVNVNPPSLATLTEGDSVVTVTGIRTGDVILAVSPEVADDRYYLKRAAVTADNQVTLSWTNETAGTVDPAALDLTFVFLPLGSVAKVGFPMGYSR